MPGADAPRQRCVAGHHQTQPHERRSGGQAFVHRRGGSRPDRARMAGARMSGAAHELDRVQGPASAGGGQSRPGHHTECGRGPYLPIAREAWRRRDHSQPARIGLPARRSKTEMSASISRRLIFWLAVPLLLMALCGSLVHYFNSVASGFIGSDRRLKEAAKSLMAHVLVKEGRVTLDEKAAGKLALSPDSVKYALRDTQ